MQGHFIDAYFNLTLKTLSILEWSWRHCTYAKFILKTDDDVYINMPVLYSIMKKAMNQSRIIMGKVAKQWKPIRNASSKYFVSPNQFKSTWYPDFNTGPAYMLTNDSILPLFQKALSEPYLHLEDVFITGIVAGYLNINHINDLHFFNRRNKLDTCSVIKLASVHMVETHEMFDLWARLSNRSQRCPPPKKKDYTEIAYTTTVL